MRALLLFLWLSLSSVSLGNWIVVLDVSPLMSDHLDDVVDILERLVKSTLEQNVMLTLFHNDPSVEPSAETFVESVHYTYDDFFTALYAVRVDSSFGDDCDVCGQSTFTAIQNGIDLSVSLGVMGASPWSKNNVFVFTDASRNLQDLRVDELNLYTYEINFFLFGTCGEVSCSENGIDTGYMEIASLTDGFIIADNKGEIIPYIGQDYVYVGVRGLFEPGEYYTDIMRETERNTMVDSFEIASVELLSMFVFICGNFNSNPTVVTVAGPGPRRPGVQTYFQTSSCIMIRVSPRELGHHVVFVSFDNGAAKDDASLIYCDSTSSTTDKSATTPCPTRAPTASPTRWPTGPTYAPTNEYGYEGTINDPEAGGWNDPHFEKFNGEKYYFSDKQYNLDEYLFDYAIPCNESDLTSVAGMPIRVVGKHMRLSKTTSVSGVEYIIFQIFDDRKNAAYVVWLSSTIHSWMKTDVKEVIAHSNDNFFMYDNIANSSKTELISHQAVTFGKKFKFVYYSVVEGKEVRGRFTIKNGQNGDCEIRVHMRYQNPAHNINSVKDPVEYHGRHGMHRFKIEMPCFYCQTCGLLGSNLCHDGDQYQYI